MGRFLILSLAALALAAGCSRAEAPHRYPLQGQILAVRADRQQITIKHGDIVGYMPAMTMSYPVASPALLEGRTPGEIISATIEVGDPLAGGRLVEVTHVGWAKLPEDSNEVGLATGLLGEGEAVPDAAFIDQSNRRRSFAEWKGDLTLVTFIYTRCPLPNFCPLMDQNFAAIQRSVAKDDALRGRVKLVSISFDPDYDTPAVLAQHAARLKADPAVWTFLTGDRMTVDRFAAQFGVGVIRPTAGSTGITHNLRTALVGADGRILKLYSGSDWTPGRALADVRVSLDHAR